MVRARRTRAQVSSDLQAAFQRERMHADLHRRAPGGGGPREAAKRALGRHFASSLGRVDGLVGEDVQKGLHCGMKWDMFAPSEPGWRGSSHSSTSAR